MDIIMKDMHSTPDISTITTENLIIGDYTTYKKLCELLNEPYKNGNAKEAQLKEWKRYFDYEKIGTKFLILDVYNEPLEKEYQYPSSLLHCSKFSDGYPTRPSAHYS